MNFSLDRRSVTLLVQEALIAALSFAVNLAIARLAGVDSRGLVAVATTFEPLLTGITADPLAMVVLTHTNDLSIEQLFVAAMDVALLGAIVCILVILVLYQGDLLRGLTITSLLFVPFGSWLSLQIASMQRRGEYVRANAIRIWQQVLTVVGVLVAGLLWHGTAAVVATTSAYWAVLVVLAVVVPRPDFRRRGRGWQGLHLWRESVVSFGLIDNIQPLVYRTLVFKAGGAYALGLTMVTLSFTRPGTVIGQALAPVAARGEFRRSLWRTLIPMLIAAAVAVLVVEPLALRWVGAGVGFGWPLGLVTAGAGTASAVASIVSARSARLRGYRRASVGKVGGLALQSAAVFLMAGLGAVGWIGAWGLMPLFVTAATV